MALILYHGLDSAVQARSQTVDYANAAYNLDPTVHGEKMEWANCRFSASLVAFFATPSNPGSLIDSKSFFVGGQDDRIARMG